MKQNTTTENMIFLLMNLKTKTMTKDINFYTECLRRELIKPLNKQDFGYMIHLNEIINKLKNK